MPGTAPACGVRRRHPLARLVVGLVLALLAASVLLAAPGAGRAAADETALPQGPSLGGAGGGVRYAVPPGITPSALEAVLTVDPGTDTDSGDAVDEVSVLVGDRVAATVPAETGPIRVPVSRADVVDGVLAVRLGLDEGACPPGPDAAPITLTDLTLVHDGVELEPTGPEDFWPGFASRIDVVVPGRADDDLLEAGLNAVAALARRYGPDTPVLLSSASTQLPRTGFGQRIVRLASGDGPVQTQLTSRFGLPELDLAGGADELRSAVRALAYGDDLTADVPPPAVPAQSRTFADLGADQVAVGGDDGTVGVLRVPQDAFGQQVGGLRIRAVGTRGDLPAADDDPAPSLAVWTYVNDALVETTPLDPDDDTVSIDAEVDRSDLLPTNEVRFVVSTTTQDQGGSACAVVGAPTVGVTLDGAESGVTASPAGEVTGLAAYPQNLGDQLQVAVRPDGGLRVAAAGDAGSVVAALQGASAGLLDVGVVGADELVAGAGPGLLAGADIDDAAALDAPLQYQESVDEARPAPDTDVDVTQIFGALEAAGGGDRAVLVLGAFGPGDRESQAELRAATARAAAEKGWNALDGDLLVITRDAEPTVLAAPAPTSARSASDAEPSGLGGGWLVAAVVALLALLGLQVRRGLRLDRRARDAADDVTA